MPTLIHRAVVYSVCSLLHYLNFAILHAFFYKNNRISVAVPVSFLYF